MKKLLLFVCVFMCVFRGYCADLTSGSEILSYVRSHLPSDPLKLSGSLKVKAANNYTMASMPVEMELDWGADTPTTSYRIGEPGTKDFQSLTITWNNETPSYTFSDPSNEPTSEILDSGITWADLSFSVLWWPNAKLIDEARKINRDCYVVDVPVPDSSKTMRLWIEKNMGMLLEARTFDRTGDELSRLKIISIKKMDGMWVAKDMELSDEKTGTTTTLQISDLEWMNPKPTAEAFDPAKSINRLAFDLYHKLAEQTDGNLFFSPYSISSALAMTYAGARGDTAGQMNTVLHFAGQDITHPAFSYLRQTFDIIGEKESVQLNTANALWPQADFDFRPEYIALVEKHYGNELHPVNYTTDHEGARQQINGWVEEQTNDKIQDLIGEGALNSLTRLVLVNAIYFKGDWARQFDPDDTRPAPFLLVDGTTNNVPMMIQKEHFGLAETDAFKALEIPYAGDSLSMLILLPAGSNSLASVEKNMTADMLTGLNLNEQELMVQIPKYKIESAFGLGDTLSEMGMPLAFNEQRADFSGMDAKDQLYINKVLHKAFIEVNEEGSEAAAATGVVIGVTSVSRPKEFLADRPFLFLIRENSTGTILFMGRVMDPTT